MRQIDTLKSDIITILVDIVNDGKVSLVIH